MVRDGNRDESLDGFGVSARDIRNCHFIGRSSIISKFNLFFVLR